MGGSWLWSRSRRWARYWQSDEASSLPWFGVKIFDVGLEKAAPVVEHKGNASWLCYTRSTTRRGARLAACVQDRLPNRPACTKGSVAACESIGHRGTKEQQHEEQVQSLQQQMQQAAAHAPGPARTASGKESDTFGS